MTSSTSFFTTELKRALEENAFAIKSAETLPEETADRACAKIVLLEEKEIQVELINDGFRVQGETKLYDTLDSLLLNVSPKSMELVSQTLSSRLEGLIARGHSDLEDKTSPDVETEGEGERKVQAPPETSTASVIPSPHDPLSSERQPVTNATLTIRCIKSFEYRTEKNLVLKGLDLTTLTAGQLIEMCKQAMKTTPGFKPYKTVKLDTLKLYNQAHSHKTMNLIINLDNDEWILDDMEKTMEQHGALNETEYSLFSREAYDAFKANPTIRWD
ncbi:hypothetical protein HD553DRAFT_305660 [Filobasidium floriforme]|uniref:uncharacterized protein n=1 Tax=Filobasidium floriforme TaxID=5210 RepID=UPI001E8D123E|nr:uncharacterized protein HD553DRAFT_305660 [Filobasidium floriforme]KAH8089292.1 hypothetical protein HD553DRAFT_305660 [Filobasidium floriforme]